jgi:hypothetical protein
MTVITSCVCLSGTLQFFSPDEKNWHNLTGYRSFLNASLHIARETDLLFSLSRSLSLSLSLFQQKKCALQKKSVRFWRFWRTAVLSAQFFSRNGH